MSDTRKFSKVITDGIERAPARAMLRATGFSTEDFNKPQIGVASTGSNLTPCNLHINDLANTAVESINQSGGKAILFHTITVSDGISMGTDGMRYSLVSREVIADSIETVVSAQGLDGFLSIGGCDKNLPACAIAMARINRPAIFIYGGTIQPGKNNTDIISVFESVGKYSSGDISLKELTDVEKTAIPGPGSCGGMYTANTMASAIEALGLSLPGSSAQEAVSQDKQADCTKAGQQLISLIEKNIKPRDILSKQSFRNAIVLTIALEGSTNAILHLLAIAHAADIPLSLNDFSTIGKDVPVLADMKPAGKYSMSELISIGGILPLIKRLATTGLFDANCLTVTGTTWKEILKDIPDYPSAQSIIRDWDNPIKSNTHLVVLSGNLAPEGAVAKITGHEGEFFTGNAKVFNSEAEAMKAILEGQIIENDVVVIRYVGPKGGPGMPEMLSPTSAINGRNLSNKVALITDGRFSGGSHGFVIGHITPEASEGGTIALIENGDKITIDAVKQTIHVDLTDTTLQERKQKWLPPQKKKLPAVLSKYAKLVSSASQGAITDN